MDRRMTDGLEELRSIGRESPKRAFGIAQERNGMGSIKKEERLEVRTTQEAGLIDIGNWLAAKMKDGEQNQGRPLDCSSEGRAGVGVTTGNEADRLSHLEKWGR